MGLYSQYQYIIIIIIKGIYIAQVRKGPQMRKSTLLITDHYSVEGNKFACCHLPVCVSTLTHELNNL